MAGRAGSAAARAPASSRDLRRGGAGGRDDPAEGRGSHTPALMPAASPAEREVPKSEARAPVLYGCGRPGAGPAGRTGAFSLGPERDAGQSRVPVRNVNLRRWASSPSVSHLVADHRAGPGELTVRAVRSGLPAKARSATWTPGTGGITGACGRSWWRTPRSCSAGTWSSWATTPRCPGPAPAGWFPPGHQGLHVEDQRPRRQLSGARQHAAKLAELFVTGWHLVPA